MMDITKLTQRKGLNTLFFLFIVILLVACRTASGKEPTASPTVEPATPTPVLATVTSVPATQEPTITPLPPTATPDDQPTAGPTATVGVTAAPTQVAVTPTVPNEPQPSPARIEFETGAYSALVAGNLQAGNSDHYVLRAIDAQLMNLLVESAGGNVVVGVRGADGQVLQSLDQGLDGWAGHLPATQDYFLTAQATGGDTDYSLRVTVAHEVMPPPPERISLEPDVPATTVRGSVPPFTYIPYVLFAEAGQKICIEISSANSSSNFTLLGLSDGQPYKRMEFPETVWEFESPISQDYEIAVRSRLGGDYTLTITPETPAVPVIINPGSPPDNACVAVHPGDVAPPVGVYAGPGEGFALIAHLGNWAQVVKISGPWQMILVAPGEIGWTNDSSADLVGPCEGVNAAMLITLDETPAYSSPSDTGELLFTIEPMTVIDPLGRNADSSWWAVFIPGDGDIPPGWISANSVTIVGNAGDAPVLDNN